MIIIIIGGEGKKGRLRSLRSLGSSIGRKNDDNVVLFFWRWRKGPVLRREKMPALNVSHPVRRQLALVSKGPAIYSFNTAWRAAVTDEGRGQPPTR